MEFHKNAKDTHLLLVYAERARGATAATAAFTTFSRLARKLAEGWTLLGLQYTPLGCALEWLNELWLKGVEDEGDEEQDDSPVVPDLFEDQSLPL
ncbi:hypothetical protein IAT38_004996 [Cryptococcus sp. DSM 104549]